MEVRAFYLRPKAAGLIRVVIAYTIVAGIAGTIRLSAQQAEPPKSESVLEAARTPDSSPIDCESLVLVQAGELPVIVSAPHGGTGEIPGVPPRVGTGIAPGPAGYFTGRDVGTEQLAIEVAAAIQRRMGRSVYLVVSRVHRKYIDFNRPAEIAFEHEAARPVYDRYHDQLESACRAVAGQFHCGLLIDIHGQGTARDTVFRGTRNGRTVTLLQQRFGDSALHGDASLFGLLAARGWKVDPHPLDGKEQSGFTGGHIVNRFGSHQNTAIDAVQFEFGADYTARTARSETARVLADAIAVYAQAYMGIQIKEEPLAGPIR